MDLDSGVKGKRSGIKVQELGRKAFPVVVNHLKTLDLSTEDGHRRGDPLQRGDRLGVTDRLEARAGLEVFFAHVGDFEVDLAGAERLRTEFVQGFKSMPVRFTTRS